MAENLEDVLISQSMTPAQLTTLESLIVTAKQSLWERVKASWTMLWGAILIASGVVLDIVPIFFEFIGTPEAADLVTFYGGPWGPHILKALGVITWLCRLKGLVK